MAHCLEDTVEIAEELLQFDNDLLLEAFREFLAALASALYTFSHRRSFQRARVVSTPLEYLKSGSQPAKKS